MFKRIRLKSMLWIAVPLVVLVIAWLVISALDRPHVFRLVAHYSAGEMPPANAPRLHGSATSEYRKYLDEGPPATFSETGLFVYETGGDPVHCDQEDAIVAKRDWQGRRQWAVTLPKSAVHRFAVSPDGHYLVAIHTGAPVEMWKDGKSRWKWQPPGLAAKDQFRVTNDGRLFAWTNGRLSIVQDGQLLASHPHLPLEDMRYESLTQLQLTPDGSALVGLIHPRSPGDDDFAYYFGETPTLIYQALTIKGRKIVPVTKYRTPFPYRYDVLWFLLADGSVLTERGTMYLPDGSTSDTGGWGVVRPGGKKSAVLWRGNWEILSRRTPRGPRFRLLDTRTLRSKKFTLTFDQQRPFGDIVPSSDGRYVLTYGPASTFPPTIGGKLARALAAKQILTGPLTQWFTRDIRFDLCDLDGQVLTSVNAFTTAGGRRYGALKYTLSPDARHLVELSMRDDGMREYLHFER